MAAMAAVAIIHIVTLAINHDEDYTSYEEEHEQSDEYESPPVELSPALFHSATPWLSHWTDSAAIGAHVSIRVV